MIKTPSANRLHIGIFGKCNSGKSSLINAITGQRTAIVSEVAGTTTDTVTKPMEINGIGPCLFIDTAGFDDTGRLSEERMEQTMQAAQKSDIALMVCTDNDINQEIKWMDMFRTKQIPVIPVINHYGNKNHRTEIEERIYNETGYKAVSLNAETGEGIDTLLRVLAENNKVEQTHSITGNLVNNGDTVLMVMPQDKQAPAGRLILPQAQTIRELLDKQCVIVCCQATELKKAIDRINTPPTLVVADSQVVGDVCAVVPESTAVTTFSILYAHYKGNAQCFADGAKAIGQLTPNSRVLIAEACSHAPLDEDIGRVKIPRLLRQRLGEQLRIDVVKGNDFPKRLDDYQLIIHCGACMFNRRQMLSRIQSATTQHVPITNYGMAIAYIKGVLNRMSYPQTPAHNSKTYENECQPDQ